MPTKKTTAKTNSTKKKSAAGKAATPKKAAKAKKGAPKVPAGEKTKANKAAPLKKRGSAKPKTPAEASLNATGQAMPALTDEQIAVAAYFRYEKRIAGGESQDDVADWHAACEELGVAV